MTKRARAALQSACRRVARARDVLIAAVLLPLHVSAAADTLGADHAGVRRLSPDSLIALVLPHSGVVTPNHLLAIALTVPTITQARERCGQAALGMVLRYYGADAAALTQVDAAYDPVLHGSLITDLAAAARRAGFHAQIATLDSDALLGLLQAGVPPIVLYQNGTGPLTVRHFGVVTGWDPEHRMFTLHDGTREAKVTGIDDLSKRWETAGSQALIVRRIDP